jgi:hypothetical protein
MHTRKPHREKDLCEIPLYSPAEAAHYLHLPAATLRSWVDGRIYKKVDGSEAARNRFSLALLSGTDVYPLPSFWYC